MTQARLIICPRSHFDAPASVSDIAQLMSETGLLADEFKKYHYYAGDNFISLITFLGCSPNIQLSPKDGDNYCYISLSDITPKSHLLGYCRAIAPKCPQCRNTIKDWQDTENWQNADSITTCHHCQSTSALSDLKWRQQGGYGRFSLSIANIHPHEAVPADSIFESLGQLSGFEWTYFYTNNENLL